LVVGEKGYGDRGKVLGIDGGRGRVWGMELGRVGWRDGGFALMLVPFASRDGWLRGRDGLRGEVVGEGNRYGVEFLVLMGLLGGEAPRGCMGFLQIPYRMAVKETTV
jgi:hypothetical protein